MKNKDQEPNVNNDVQDPEKMIADIEEELKGCIAGNCEGCHLKDVPDCQRAMAEEYLSLVNVMNEKAKEEVLFRNLLLTAFKLATENRNCKDCSVKEICADAKKKNVVPKEISPNESQECFLFLLSVAGSIVVDTKDEKSKALLTKRFFPEIVLWLHAIS